MVFQQFNMFGRTALEIVKKDSLLAYPIRSSKKLLGKFGKVGLSDREITILVTYSGGQKQQVALARALAMKPGFFLLDNRLQPLGSRIGWRSWKSIAQCGKIRTDHGAGQPWYVFCSTSSDKVLLRKGRIIGSGTPRKSCNIKERTDKKFFT